MVTTADREKADKLKAKKAAEEAATAAESQKKRDKRARQKEDKQKQKPSAITPELRAVLDQTQAEAAKRVAAEAEEAEAEKRKEKLRVIAAKPVPEKKAVVRATPPKQPTTYAEMDKALSTTAWGIDSMASVGLSGNKDNFAVLRSCPPVEIKTADGSIITVRKQGSVILRAHTDNGRTLTFRIDDVYAIW